MVATWQKNIKNVVRTGAVKLFGVDAQGRAAFKLATDMATSAQGTKADTALQPATGVFRIPSFVGASATSIPAAVKSVQTQFYAPNYAVPATLVGGARYRRVNSEPGVPVAAKFRSLDRWTAEGNNDSANGGWWELVTDEASFTPEKFGVVGDDAGEAAANFAKLVSWRDFCRSRGVSGKLPAKTYSVDTDPFLGFASGVDIEVEPGVSIAGPFNLAQENIRVRGGNILVNVKNGALDYKYKLTSRYHREIEDKTSWLTAGDLDHSTYKRMSFATDVRFLSVNFPAGDTFSIVSPDYVRPDGGGVVLGLSGNGKFAAVPVLGATEASAFFGGGDGYDRAALVRTSAGYYAFAASASGLGTLYYKPFGGSIVVTPNIAWPKLGIYDDWKAGDALWKIRNVNGREFVLLLNDREVLRRKVASGFITEIGFGGLKTPGTAQCEVYTLVKRDNINQPSGFKPFRILLEGDSQTKKMHGCWQKAFVDAVEGSGGATVETITNNAVGGSNSADVLTRLQTVGGIPDGTNAAIVMVGTNDCQQGVTFEVFREKLNAIVDRLQEKGVEYIILASAFHFYPQSFAAGGAATSNYKNFPRYQQEMKAVTAVRGVGYVALTEVTKSVFHDQLTDGSIDSGLRDNIHATAFTNVAVGEAKARALLSLAAGAKPSRRLVGGALHSSMMSNGWTIGATNVVSISDEGWCNIQLEINGTTISNGTVVFTTPVNLRPASTFAYPAYGYSTDSPYTEDLCGIYFNSAGQAVLTDVAANVDRISVLLSFQITIA